VLKLRWEERTLQRDSCSCRCPQRQNDMGEDTALYSICGVRCPQWTRGPVRGIEPRTADIRFYQWKRTSARRHQRERLAHNFEQFFRLRVLVLSPTVELQIVKAAIIA
jgi:hypothetical protein